MSKFHSALVHSGLNNRLKRTPVLLRFASIQQHWSDAKSRGVLLVAFCFLTVCASGHAIADDPPVFGTEIQPILAKHCFVCHGPDEMEAGLRLDRFDQAVATLESGKRAIVPGRPHDSELINRVLSNDDESRMPPEGPGVDPEEVKLIERWIASGAEFDRHWAYRPVKNVSAPIVNDDSWIKNPIDRFVLKRLESAGTVPSPQAEAATLAKRVAYDLTGLPPDPEVLRQFLEMPDDAAYEALVDQLLASPHFGERWGRHWLDMARYADSDGYEKDRARPNAWLYRDWVIKAINEDMPFDQFTREQLAGDLIDRASDSQKLATAFHRQTLTNTEGGVDQEQFRVEATFDRTETTAAIWLGLTMTCARCHNHKYDQISQQEYYQLFAFFDDLKESNINLPAGEQAVAEHDRAVQVHHDKYEAAKEKYSVAIAGVKAEIDERVVELEKLISKDRPVELEAKPVIPLSVVSAGGAKMQVMDDGSVLASGKVADKDKYTLVFEIPEGGFNGIKLEVLPHESLPSTGPGRPDNGNFVLTEMRVYVGNDVAFKENYEAVNFEHAEADFAQNNFSALGALQKKAKSGWAIAPKMGMAHEWLGLTSQMPVLRERKFVQVVLDQQYGGKHLIGRFRLTTVKGDIALRVLPADVRKVLSVSAEERTPEQDRVLFDHLASKHPVTSALAKELDQLEKSAPLLPTVSARIVSPAERVTHILHRGDFLQPAESVESGVLDVVRRELPFRSRMDEHAADRRDLADWFLDPRNPLTPRVSVNHVWMHLFGRGIVGTVDDFGVRGDQPTHPELLDWLAWNYPRTMNWSRKALIKTILMSATYRQASYHRNELRERDPTNLLLARQNRVRVSGEVVRDLYLAVSGLLKGKVGGPSVFPPLPAGVAELSYANNFKWKTSVGDDAYRRGMYTFFKRTSPDPTLISFDCPDANTTRLQRDISNTPLQALVTLNNRVFNEASQALAKLTLEQSGQDDQQRLAYAMQRVLSRTAGDGEITRFQLLLDASREYYRDNNDDAAKATSFHRHEKSSVEENAAWVATVRMILNLDEFIVRE